MTPERKRQELEDEREVRREARDEEETPQRHDDEHEGGIGEGPLM